MVGILGLGGIAATMIPGVGGVVGPLLGLTGKAAMGASPTTSTFSSVARNIGGSLGLSGIVGHEPHDGGTDGHFSQYV